MIALPRAALGALLKIAMRNLLKNRRRSFYAVLAIALGYASVNVFGGFTRYINSNLRDSFIYNQGHGHLTIFRAGFLEKGLLDPVQYLLTESETDSLLAMLRELPDVRLATPQLYVSGLLSNGKASTIFIAAGRIPSDMTIVRSGAPGMLGRLASYDGRPMSDDQPYGVSVSTGLADLLDLAVGSSAVAVGPTIEGQINALDAEVLQTFESPVELLNDKLMIVPLQFAQDLFATARADRITVLLHRTARTEAVRANLNALLAARGMNMEIRTWEDMSSMYRKVRKMFDIIFFFLFVIVLVISVMSVVNTINMAVMERVREIGTLRALGMRRARIVWLFAVESGVLGMMGSALGVLLTLAVWYGVKTAGPTWIPPMITQRIPLEIYLVPRYLWISFGFLLALSVGAATVPARRAVRQGIVDALGHV